MKVEEWLGTENYLGQDIWSKKYKFNGENFDKWVKRVSGGDPEVADLIKKKKFLFGGRTLSNRGTGLGTHSIIRSFVPQSLILSFPVPEVLREKASIRMKNSKQFSTDRCR